MEVVIPEILCLAQFEISLTAYVNWALSGVWAELAPFADLLL